MALISKKFLVNYGHLNGAEVFIIHNINKLKLYLIHNLRLDPSS
jgi:hypothetical protein